MASQGKIVGFVALFVVLLFFYTPLKAEVVVISTAQGATSFEAFLGVIFPIIWIVFLIMDLMMIYREVSG